MHGQFSPSATRTKKIIKLYKTAALRNNFFLKGSENTLKKVFQVLKGYFGAF